MFNQNEKPKDKIIFVDIDDTLADTRSAVYNLYVELTGDKSGDISVKSKRYLDFCPTWNEEHLETLFKNGYTLYDRTSCIPGAKEAIRSLIAKGYDVRVVTIHTASGIPAKQKWIDTHFPMLSEKVYYVNSVNADKNVFKEYAIIDDDIKNIEMNESCYPILLDYYNVYSETNTTKVKCKTWKEVLNYL